MNGNLQLPIFQSGREMFDMKIFGIASICVIIVSAILGYLFGVRPDHLEVPEYMAILLGIVSVDLAIVAIRQAIKTDAAINTIAVESRFVEDPWVEGANMLMSAVDNRYELLALNAWWHWPQEARSPSRLRCSS